MSAVSPVDLLLNRRCHRRSTDMKTTTKTTTLSKRRYPKLSDCVRKAAGRTAASLAYRGLDAGLDAGPDACEGRERDAHVLWLATASLDVLLTWASAR